MYIPPIIVREDIDENVKLFVVFLYHKNPQQKQRIINRYPELAEIVTQNEEQARSRIADFLRTYFQTHSEIINPIIAGIRDNLQKSGHSALEMLATIMEYRWPETHKGFTFVPCLLPFSPWDEETGTIYLSLIPYINGEAGRVENKKTLSLNATQLLVHEVSHFMLWDIVAHLDITYSPEFVSTVKHLAQEIIAPVIMNQTELRSLLNLHDYWGNQYLKPITLRTNRGNVNIIDFFSTEYATMRAEGKTFEQYILRVFEILTSLQFQLQKRMKMWNENGKKIFEKEDLFEEYIEPIDVK